MIDERNIYENITPVPKARTDELFNQHLNPEWNNSGPEILHPVTTFDSATNDSPSANQDFIGEAPFAITINGTTNSENEQTSPFTIGCIGGTALYPAIGQATTPQSVIIDDATGKSVSPASNGVSTWKVYATVNGTMTDEGVDVSSTGNIKIENIDDESELVGSNTRFISEGLGSYVFLFLIGTVDAIRATSGKYRVRINQIQQGNYSYGNVKSTTATVDGSTISTKDGLRTFTICINGEPFTCDIDVSNIVKVT